MSLKSVSKTFIDYVRSTPPSWLGLGTIVMIVATPATGYGVSHVHHGWVPALLVVQTLLALSLWGIPAYKVAKGTNDGVRVIAEERTRINDVLGVLLEEMATLANSSDALFKEQRARVQAAVLQAASTLIGPDRVRCCFFVLERVRVREAPPSKAVAWRWKLTCNQCVGRNSSHAVFWDGTEAGTPVIALVRRGDSNFFENLDEEQPVGWGPTVRGEYKTFISLGVRAKSEPIGMLSVDSLTAGDLTEQDVELLRVFGWILAAAWTMGARLTSIDLKSPTAEKRPWR